MPAAKQTQTLDFLNPVAETKPSKKKRGKKEKPSAFLPEDLGAKLDIVAAADATIDAANRKSKEAEFDIKRFLRTDFARNWAALGMRPVTKTWKGLNSSVDFIMTSDVRSLPFSKLEAIKGATGVDLVPHVKIKCFNVNTAALEENPKHYEAFKKFLAALGDDVHNIVEKQVCLSEGTFDRIGELCGRDPDKIDRTLSILDPKVMLKGKETQLSEEEAIDFIKALPG